MIVAAAFIEATLYRCWLVTVVALVVAAALLRAALHLPNHSSATSWYSGNEDFHPGKTQQ